MSAIGQEDARSMQLGHESFNDLKTLLGKLLSAGPWLQALAAAYCMYTGAKVHVTYEVLVPELQLSSRTFLYILLLLAVYIFEIQ